jgi:hypothetical protein
MNTILWILQIILCIKFLSTAFSHGLQKNNPNMQQSINKFGHKGLLLHKIISVIVFLGALAMILPGLFGIHNWITVYSAILLAILMMLSILFHVLSREKPVIIADIILMVLVIFVAYGRGILAPG